MAKTKKRGPTPPRAVRLEARGRPGQIRPTADRRKRQRRRNLVMAGIIALLVGGTIVGGYLVVKGDKTKPLPGASTAVAPWPPEETQLSRRIARIGLPTVGNAFHNHVHLDIFVEGQPVPGGVPNGIGFINGSVFSAIHTHNTSGVIHLEGATPFAPTLGEVFAVWGVNFTKDSLGGYQVDGSNPLAVYVNGKKLTTDPTAYKLQEHDEIAAVYGTPPSQIPKDYKFPKNL